MSAENEEERVLLHDERSCIFETRVERASQCRDHGSVAFSALDISKAIAWYERALYHVDFDEGTWHFEFLDKHRDIVNSVRLPVHLNLAMCYLGTKSDKERNLEKVIEHTDAALKIDKKNVKALYRSGKAYLLRGDLDQAKIKLKDAVQLQPNDKYIREALEEVVAKISAQRVKDKETWGGRLLEATEKSDNVTTSTPQSFTDSSVSNSSIFSSWITWFILVTAIVAGLVLLWTEDAS